MARKERKSPFSNPPSLLELSKRLDERCARLRDLAEQHCISSRPVNDNTTQRKMAMFPLDSEDVTPSQLSVKGETHSKRKEVASASEVNLSPPFWQHLHSPTRDHGGTRKLAIVEPGNSSRGVKSERRRMARGDVPEDGRVRSAEQHQNEARRSENQETAVVRRAAEREATNKATKGRKVRAQRK